MLLSMVMHFTDCLFMCRSIPWEMISRRIATLVGVTRASHAKRLIRKLKQFYFSVRSGFLCTLIRLNSQY